MDRINLVRLKEVRTDNRIFRRIDYAGQSCFGAEEYLCLSGVDMVETDISKGRVSLCQRRNWRDFFTLWSGSCRYGSFDVSAGFCGSGF